MFVVVVLYCVQFFSDVLKFSHSPFALSFAKVFLFYFFEFHSISQNIGCIIKTPLKHSTQTIFQGGIPWATLIVNNMFVVVVLYCVQFFSEVNMWWSSIVSSFFLRLTFLKVNWNQLKINWNQLIQNHSDPSPSKAPSLKRPLQMFRGGPH